MRVGDRLYAGCWHGGVRIVDVSDIRKPKTIGAYNYHPPFPEPSHTFMALPKKIDGRQIAVAIDEEDHAHSADEMAKRRGRPHAAMWTFDITDPAKIQPLATRRRHLRGAAETGGRGLGRAGEWRPGAPGRQVHRRASRQSAPQVGVRAQDPGKVWLAPRCQPPLVPATVVALTFGGSPLSCQSGYTDEWLHRQSSTT